MLENDEERNKYVESISIPKRPEISRWLLILSIMLILVSFYFKSIDKLIWFLRFILAGGLLIFYNIANYLFDKRTYNYAVNEFDKYKQQLIDEYDRKNEMRNKQENNRH